MKPVLAVFMTLALVSVAAPAAAQDQAPTRVQVEIDAFDLPLKAGEVATTNLTVEYFYHVTGVLALSNTKVELRVVEAPANVVTTVSPTTLHFTVGSDGGTPGGQMMSAGTEDAKLLVAPLENSTADDVGSIRIAAYAEPNSPLQGSTGEDSVLVEIEGVECHDGHETTTVTPASSDGNGTGTEASADALADSEEATDLEAASAGGPAPVVSSTSAAIIGLGLAGAGTGALIARRRGR